MARPALGHEERAIIAAGRLGESPASTRRTPAARGSMPSAAQARSRKDRAGHDGDVDPVVGAQQIDGALGDQRRARAPRRRPARAPASTAADQRLDDRRRRPRRRSRLTRRARRRRGTASKRRAAGCRDVRRQTRCGAVISRAVRLPEQIGPGGPEAHHEGRCAHASRGGVDRQAGRRAGGPGGRSWLSTSSTSKGRGVGRQDRGVTRHPDSPYCGFDAHRAAAPRGSERTLGPVAPACWTAFTTSVVAVVKDDGVREVICSEHVAPCR